MQIYEDFKRIFQAFEENLPDNYFSLRNIEVITKDVLKMIDDGAREIIFLFPKSILIIMTINTALAILSGNIFFFVGLALNSYLIYRHKNILISAMNSYRDLNTNEWSLSYDEKQALKIAIIPRACLYTIRDSARIFFHGLF